MRRGTTQPVQFSIPYKASEVEEGYVTFTQGGLIILDKSVNDDDVTLEDGVIRFQLSQEDTLALPTGEIAMQIRLLLNNGEAAASYAMETYVDDVLKDGVI